MQISFAAPTSKLQTGSWVVAAWEGRVLSPAAVKADKASAGALGRALKSSRFTGKSGEFLEILSPEGLTVSRLLLVGLGKPGELREKSLEVIPLLPSKSKFPNPPGSNPPRRRPIWPSARGCAAMFSTNTGPAIWTTISAI